MAITAAQRALALQAVIGAAINGAPVVPSGTPLAVLLPGVTPATVFSTIAAALGTSQDATLTTALANLVALYSAQLTGAQAGVTAIQAEITAATVV